MKILTLNCWGGRIPSLPGFLAQIEADVYCLQEVYSAPKGTPPFFTPRIDWPIHVRLFEELSERLPDHRASFYPMTEGWMFDEAEKKHRIQSGIATFVKRTLPIIKERMEFTGAYQHNKGKEIPPSRNMHSIQIWRSDVQKPLTVTHMHGLWIPNGKGDTPERIKQAYVLKYMCQDMWGDGKDGDMVVCGDFNVLPESATFRILGSLGLKELVTGNGHTGTRTGFYTRSPERFADYMFVSDSLVKNNFEVLTRPEVSDHCPLLLYC